VRQRTEEWWDARLGCVTASNFKDVLSKGEARKTYMYKVWAERMTGQREPEFSSVATRWGNEYEERAIFEIMDRLDVDISSCGFITLPANVMVGASPDGLIGDDRLVEVKCPYSLYVHAKTLIEGMPAEHKPQVQGGLMVTGRKAAIFASYSPRFQGAAQLYIEVVERDEKYIEMLLGEVLKFDSQVLKLEINDERKKTGLMS